MGETFSKDEVLRLRVTAQGLCGGFEKDQPAARANRSSGAEHIAETARRMLAVQGQDWRSARWALGLRSPGTSVADVHEAFNSGLIVRSWPMRGTIHLLAAEDIGWMQKVTNPRVLSGAAKRREFLGISDETLEKLVEVSVDALRGSAGMDRDELTDAWTEAGVEWQSNWRYHLIWWLCQNGIAVLGPVSERGEPRLVLASEWIGSPRELGGDEALLELAARYASARGAVTAKDLAWWAGITAGAAKQGLAHATQAGRLVQLYLASEGKPVVLWADPTQLERSASAELRDWLLLPAFDEHLLGYQDRSPQLDPAHFERIVPGRNGLFLATVVRDGRVVGTWKKSTRKDEGLIGTPLPGEKLGAGRSALGRLAKQWGEFRGLGKTPFALASA